MGPQNAGQEKLLLITDEVLHKGECIYAEKIILVHFISMQINFPVLSTSSCVAPQNAGVMDCSMQVYLFSLFLETEHFLKRWYLLTAGYFIATFCAYRQNKRKMDDFLHTLDTIADFHWNPYKNLPIYCCHGNQT